MRNSQGSVLAVVLIMVAALYLLAGMMFMVNRQYFSDIHMARKSIHSRQHLLSAGQELMVQAQHSRMNSDDEVLTWDDCDLLNYPESQQYNESKVFYQSSQLADHCHNHVSHRLWLSSLDNSEDRLVMDQITLREYWQDSIIEDDQFVDVIAKDDAWWFILDNGILKKEFVLIESELLPKLSYKKMRIHQNHYELVLVFEDPVEQQLILNHFWIPIKELHFDVAMVFKFHTSHYETYDHVDILTMNMNDVRNPNWQIVLDQRILDSVLLRNNVLFASLHNQNQKEQSSIIAMHLSGMPFLGDRLLGIEHKSSDEVIELIPCLYRPPLIVAMQWQVGCDVQKKIRYYFPE